MSRGWDTVRDTFDFPRPPLVSSSVRGHRTLSRWLLTLRLFVVTVYSLSLRYSVRILPWSHRVYHRSPGRNPSHPGLNSELLTSPKSPPVFTRWYSPGRFHTSTPTSPEYSCAPTDFVHHILSSLTFILSFFRLLSPSSPGTYPPFTIDEGTFITPHWPSQMCVIL